MRVYKRSTCFCDDIHYFIISYIYFNTLNFSGLKTKILKNKIDKVFYSQLKFIRFLLALRKLHVKLRYKR